MRLCHNQRMTLKHANIVTAVERALRTEWFFAPPPGSLRIERVENEESTWELFRGHLLDATRTRQRREFALVWHVHLDGDTPSEPRISVRFDAEERTLHVTRRLLVRGFAAVDAGSNVIEAKPVVKWLEELVGSIAYVDECGGVALARDAGAGRHDGPDLDVDALANELSRYISLAVTGVSRLPITSVEAPLPEFALGQLAYIPGLDSLITNLNRQRDGQRDGQDDAPRDGHRGSDASHGNSIDALWQFALGATPTGAAARALEAGLRAAEGQGELAALTDLIRATPGGGARALELVQTMFHEVSLSPFTRWAPNTIRLLDSLSSSDLCGVEGPLDVASHMLRHLVRHLTAYDLVTFHSFGANYPDALWLDALLRWFLGQLEDHPELATDRSVDSPATLRRKRLRRRALRQAWIVRRQYEGHRVPDAPTSRGENQRVIAGEPAVPEEQITQPAARRRRLFDDSPSVDLLGPNTRQLLAAALRDLASGDADAARRANVDEHEFDGRATSELLELGIATFLDRPFGVLKETGAADRSPMLAYEAFSRQVARRRLIAWRRAAEQAGIADSITSTKSTDSTNAAAPSHSADPTDSRDATNSSDSKVSADATSFWRGLEQRLTELRPSGVPVGELPAVSRPGVIMLEDARVAADDFIVTRTAAGSLRRLAEVPGMWSEAQRATIVEWSNSNRPLLLIRRHSPADVRTGAALLTLLSDDLRPRAEIRLARSASPAPLSYVERFGVEFPSFGPLLDGSFPLVIADV